MTHRRGQKRYALMPSVLLALTGGCAPSARLTFPAQPVVHGSGAWKYDVDANGMVDFALRVDENGRYDILAYDDDEDGEADRLYRMSEYDIETVPHVIIMLDSIAYRTAMSMFRDGAFPFFRAPAKVIPPFPSMSEVIFSTLLHTAPQPGMINRHYDRRTGKVNNMIVRRALGKPVPMDIRLDYRLAYWEGGMMFLSPRPWFGAEMHRAKQVVDENQLRVSILYFASTAGLVSKYGEAGAVEALDGIMQLCMQLLYERQGAVKISILSDHGHNYIKGRRFDVEAVLAEAGFNPTKRLRRPGDVVIDVDGMINYSGMHTHDPRAVATILAEQDAVQIVSFLEGERVIVRDRHGEAAILRRDGRYGYEPLTHDVLGFGPVLEQLDAAGELDDEGMADAEAWFTATVDHEYPDAVHRLWRAFHGLAINPPDVMAALGDGYYFGLAHFEWYIDMASTHGGIDQANSATFVMTMTDCASAPMRSRDVLPAIEPAFITKDGGSR